MQSYVSKVSTCSEIFKREGGFCKRCKLKLILLLTKCIWLIYILPCRLNLDYDFFFGLNFFFHIQSQWLTDLKFCTLLNFVDFKISKKFLLKIKFNFFLIYFKKFLCSCNRIKNNWYLKKQNKKILILHWYHFYFYKIV